jgi:hypothetical protein
MRAACAASAALRTGFRRAKRRVPTLRRKAGEQPMRSGRRKPPPRRALPTLRAGWHAS